MGMDVDGRAPRSPAGEYFRASIWSWHPLADYCQLAAPEIAARCKLWHYNDGDGLGDEDAQALAAVLEAGLRDGTYERLCFALRGLPANKENYGAISAMRAVFGPSLPAYESREMPSREQIERWCAFLRDCGGFKIY